MRCYFLKECFLLFTYLDKQSIQNRSEKPNTWNPFKKEARKQLKKRPVHCEKYKPLRQCYGPEFNSSKSGHPIMLNQTWFQLPCSQKLSSFIHICLENNFIVSKHFIKWINPRKTRSAHSCSWPDTDSQNIWSWKGPSLRDSLLHWPSSTLLFTSNTATNTEPQPFQM